MARENPAPALRADPEEASRHLFVSITLTTLAAHAYQNQEDVFDALTCIAARMSTFIEKSKRQMVGPESR